VRNYVEKDYFQLLGHLDYNQYTPPLFSWLVKFSMDIFGMNEYTPTALSFNSELSKYSSFL